MALVIRLSKGIRDYILKAHRDEWWQQRIKEAESELAALPYGSPDTEKKTKEITQLKEAHQEANTLLAKFGGPTIFKIKSVSKPEIRASMPKDLRKRYLKISEEEGVTVETIDYSRDYSMHVCKLGITGWENLIDYDTKEGIPFGKDIIQEFPDDVLGEIANEISGVIDRDDIKNLKKPSS